MAHESFTRLAKEFIPPGLVLTVDGGFVNRDDLEVGSDGKSANVVVIPNSDDVLTAHRLVTGADGIAANRIARDRCKTSAREVLDRLSEAPLNPEEQDGFSRSQEAQDGFNIIQEALLERLRRRAYDEGWVVGAA